MIIPRIDVLLSLLSFMQYLSCFKCYYCEVPSSIAPIVIDLHIVVGDDKLRVEYVRILIDV